MDAKELRRVKRFQLRFPIEYEQIKDGSKSGLAVNTAAKDLNPGGISFYAQQTMEVGTKVLVTFPISQVNVLTLNYVVVRVTTSEIDDKDFVIAAKIDSIGEEEKAKLNEFLRITDIDQVLDSLDLEDVMDVNFVSGYAPIVKKSGKLKITDGDVFDSHILRVLLLNILDEYAYQKFMEEKELNLVYTTKKGARFRVNIHIQRSLIEATFRVVAAKINSPSQLGLPPVVEKLLENEKGLILIAGKTGSGKTTTLSSMIEYLNNKRDGIIICIEDPVEYLHKSDKCIIKQREVGRDTLSYSNAAKNALRQNPDVLVIGEILDEETMDIAMTAAETGMLVISSMHAADSAQALDRITSFFPADLQKHILGRLSLVLRGVITQDLIPRSDKKGLIVATEILMITSAMKRVIREGDFKQIPSLLQMGKNVGMQSMSDCLKQYFQDGLIDSDYIKGLVD